MKFFIYCFYPSVILFLSSCFFHANSWQGTDIHGNNPTGNFDIRYKTMPSKTIAVKINKNIELFGLMMQLDMGPDLLASNDSVILENKKSTWRNWYATGYKNYLKYKQFDSCAMMQLYRELVSKKMYNDFFIGFLEQVDEVPFAKLIQTTDRESIMAFSENGNFEEAKKKAAAFLKMFNQFYNLINFGSYLEENKQYYAIIKSDVEKNLPNERFIPTMENFYGKKFAAYCLIPSLNIPTSMGFGKMSSTRQIIYNAFGPFSFQTFDANNPDLGFNYPDRISGLTVHEFGHSFVNPAIDQLPKELITSTEYLYLPIKEAMSKKSYTNWVMCLYEHFVKAGEVLIARKLGTVKNEEGDIQQSVKSGSVYLPFIIKELEAYDNNKDPQKKYADFLKATMGHLKAVYKK